MNDINTKTVIRSICAYGGCGALINRGVRWCEKHAAHYRKQQEQKRPQAHQRGYDHRWRRYRLSYLKQHPLCCRCSERGCTVAAVVVDHIETARKAPERFWDKSNHQPLCKPCHDRKTYYEDGGLGNAPGE